MVIELPVYNHGHFEPRPSAPREALPVVCVSLKRKGRKPPPYGRAARCTTCRRPPRYSNRALVDCECGAPPNPHAPAFLVQLVEDIA